MEKLCKKSSISQLLVSSTPFLVQPLTFGQPHLSYATFFPWRERNGCREERKRKKGQKKWFFEIPHAAFFRVFYLSTILFLPRLGSALLPCYPPLPLSLVLIFLEGRFTRWNSSLVREGGLRRESSLFFTRRCTKKEGQ